MMAYPLPRLAVPLPPGRAPSQMPLPGARSQEGGTSPTCCTTIPSSSLSLPRPPGCLGAPPGSLCSCCPPGSSLLHSYPAGLLTGLPEGVAGHPYLTAPGLPGVPTENPALYQAMALGGAFDPKDNHEFWSALRQSPYFPYEQGLLAHPYANAFALDPNARRKNATREGTNTLKAWLNEHKKNPYPTKGEKIMLAIITKMTLTQVSTWFANARRRLKKDNKVTWTTRGTDDDDDECLSSDEEGKGNRKSEEQEADDDDLGEDICVTDDDMPDPLLTRLSPADSLTSPEIRSSRGDGGSAAMTSSVSVPAPRPDGVERSPTRPRLLSDTLRGRTGLTEGQKSSPTSTTTSAKPKIWSLADVASKDSDSPGSGGPGSPTSTHYPGAWRSAVHPYSYPRPAMIHAPLKVDTSPSLLMSSATVSSSSSSAAATLSSRSISPDQ